MQFGLGRWPLLIASHNLDRARHGQIERPDQTCVQCSVADTDAEVGAPNTSLRQDFRENPLRSAGRHCKANALSHRNNGCIDADHPPTRIDEGTTRVSRIERRRVLNDSFYEPPVTTSKRAPQRTDDTSRDC